MSKNCPFDKNFKVIDINFADIVSGYLPQASFQKVRFSSQSNLCHLRIGSIWFHGKFRICRFCCKLDFQIEFDFENS